MAISFNIDDREYNKFKESTATAGVPGVVVVNSDGTNVASSVGGTVTANQGTANASHAQAWWTRLTDATNDLALFASGADTVSNTTVQAPVGAFPYVYNGATWDRVQGRSDTDGMTKGLIDVIPGIYNGTNIDRLYGARALSQTTLNGTLNSYTNGGSGIPTILNLGWDNTGAAQAYRALAVDSTGSLKLSTLPAGTNVIGHIIADSGSTTAVTGNVTVVQPTGTNLHAVLDTTSTTAVTQATGTNLHTVIDSGTITTVSAVTAITNALPAGTNILGALSANQSVNVAQINGITPLMGNGVTGTGSQRVTIASDNTAFAVNATLQTSTNSVGTVGLNAGTNVIGALSLHQSTNIDQIGGSALSLGAKASASSIPVVIANDQAPPPITTGTAIASATYTTTQTQADVTSNGFKGIKVIFNISAYTDGTYKLEIDGKDPISGNYFALVADAVGLTSATLKTYSVYPSLVAVTNQNAADILTSTWRVKVVASGVTLGATFSVSYELIP